MEYEIKSIVEKSNCLVVEVEHDFGVDSFSFSLMSRKLDPETDEPRFLGEVKKSLEEKYGDDTRKTKIVYKEFCKKYNHDKINIKKKK